MRPRKRSSVALDSYYRIVYQTILCHQDATTGLLPGDTGVFKYYGLLYHTPICVSKNL